MNRNREMLLRELMELGIRKCDLHLYLDTHQNETRAIKEYNITSNKYNTMKNHYEKLYGPLTLDDKDSCDEMSWQWVNGPWPWEHTLHENIVHETTTMTGGASNVDL